MNKQKSILDGLTPAQQQAEIDRAREVLRKSSEYVIGELDERNEQLLALAYALEKELAPPDPENMPCDHPLTAWRLSQLLANLLSCTASINAARAFLLGEK